MAELIRAHTEYLYKILSDREQMVPDVTSPSGLNVNQQSIQQWVRYFVWNTSLTLRYLKHVISIILSVQYSCQVLLVLQGLCADDCPITTTVCTHP